MVGISLLRKGEFKKFVGEEWGKSQKPLFI